MYSDRRGNGQKPPRTKPPGQKPREQLRENLYMGLLSGFFCTRPTKNQGRPRCVTYFWGVPGCVTQCDRGGGSKLEKNRMMYFMDGFDGNSVMIPVKSISRKLSFPILINAQQFNLSCNVVDQCGVFMSSRRENSTYIYWFISL